MDFPSGQFDFDVLTTQDLFESVHRAINVIIHLHHSHVTGKILGYVHDFCNMKMRENQNVVVITTAQLHSTKPELRFCAGSNPARGVLEIHDGEDL